MCYVYMALIVFIVFVRGKFLYDAVKMKKNVQKEIIVFIVFMLIAFAIGYYKVGDCF